VSPGEIIERERRWALPAALATFVAVVVFVVLVIVSSSKFGASGDAEHLREINKDSGTFLLISILQGLAAALLAVPLTYLFQAASARSDVMRRQLIGLVIAGPLFLAVAYLLNGIVVHDAAPEFVAKGIVGNGDHADQVARDLIADQSLQGLGIGFLIGGGLGFAIGTAYSCFYAMRTGLLTRFWGSLGMALGVVSVINAQFFQFTLLWMVYLGLLILGRAPGGRPPAWAAGEAIPWPTPGEKAAESLAGEEEPSGSDVPARGRDEEAEEPAAANPPRPPDERRKRKRRR
jgi:hypothetical protein